MPINANIAGLKPLRKRHSAMPANAIATVTRTRLQRDSADGRIAGVSHTVTSVPRRANCQQNGTMVRSRANQDTADCQSATASRMPNAIPVIPAETCAASKTSTSPIRRGRDAVDGSMRSRMRSPDCTLSSRERRRRYTRPPDPKARRKTASPSVKASSVVFGSQPIGHATIAAGIVERDRRTRRLEAPVDLGCRNDVAVAGKAHRHPLRRLRHLKNIGVACQRRIRLIVVRSHDEGAHDPALAW